MGRRNIPVILSFKDVNEGFGWIRIINRDQQSWNTVPLKEKCKGTVSHKVYIIIFLNPFEPHLKIVCIIFLDWADTITPPPPHRISI